MVAVVREKPMTTTTAKNAISVLLTIPNFGLLIIAPFLLWVNCVVSRSTRLHTFVVLDGSRTGATPLGCEDDWELLSGYGLTNWATKVGTRSNNYTAGYTTARNGH